MNQTHRFKLGSRSAAVLRELTRLAATPAYARGGRLPNELELCRRYKVSRTTVRKAVACLVEEGRVVVRKRAGMFLLGPEEIVRQRTNAATVAVMGYLDAEELGHLQEQALEKGHLICAYSQNEARWNSARERMFLEQVREAHHRGLIAFLSPLDPRNDQLVSGLAADGVRVVHLEYSSLALPAEGYRLCDYRQAGRVAAVEFLMAGYPDLAFIRATDAPYEVLLEEGFAAALREHGAGFSEARNRVDARRIPGGAPDGASRLRARLRELPREIGLFCPNDLVLRDLMAYAEETGWRCPDELGVTVLQFGSKPYRPDVDSLVYDRAEDYRKALADILAPAWEKPQGLQPVTVVRRGSVRGRPATRAP